MAADLDRPASLHLMALRDQTPSRMGARMTALLPEIESALANGFTRHAIHDALVVSGLQIGFLGFVKSLYRARRKVRAMPAQSATVAPLISPPSPGPATHNQVKPSPAPALVETSPASRAISTQQFEPGMISEIARNKPDMVELGRIGREYAAKLAAEKSAKAAALSETSKSGKKP